MSVIDRAQAHRQSTRTPLSEMAAQLNAGLGTTLVALLGNSNDRKQAIRWAEGASPRVPTEQRLRAAYEAWVLLAANESEAIARAWFIGTNPLLDDRSPVEVLRETENNTGRVLGAAAQFVALQ